MLGACESTIMIWGIDVTLSVGQHLEGDGVCVEDLNMDCEFSVAR